MAYERERDVFVVNKIVYRLIGSTCHTLSLKSLHSDYYVIVLIYLAVLFITIFFIFLYFAGS